MCVDTGGGDLIYPRYTRILLGDHDVNRFVDIAIFHSRSRCVTTVEDRDRGVSLFYNTEKMKRLVV